MTDDSAPVVTRKNRDPRRRLANEPCQPRADPFSGGPMPRLVPMARPERRSEAVEESSRSSCIFGERRSQGEHGNAGQLGEALEASIGIKQIRHAELSCDLLAMADVWMHLRAIRKHDESET